MIARLAPGRDRPWIKGTVDGPSRAGHARSMPGGAGAIAVGLVALALLAPARGAAQAPPRRTPAFTDDDLARYREERLRGESASPAAAPPPPAPASRPAAGSPARATAHTPSVELRDVNHALPPDLRAAAEAAGRRFITFFGAPVEATLVIPLRYFPDPAAYRDHLARNVPQKVSWTGYYDPRLREIVVSGGPDTRGVLLHEINHFVFDTVFDEAPVWLREGLAEYFETASATEQGLAVADQAAHRRTLAEWRKGDRQPDLRQLLALNRSLWMDHELADSRRVRALSWSVIDFLMSSRPGQQTLHAFLSTLEDQRGLHSLQAFDRSFEGGAAAFERRWLEHVEKLAAVE